MPSGSAQWPGFSTVFFDCDSTLVGVEGIDELAKRKGLGDDVAAATRRAMEGSSPLESIYEERLQRLQLTRADLKALGEIYRRSLVPDAPEAVAALQAAGCSVYLVSGGLLPAVQSLARTLRVPVEQARAVAVRFDELTGEWWQSHLRSGGGDEARYLACAPSPLAETRGKIAVIREILGPGPGAPRALLVGDGVTDWEAREAVRLFVGFGGVVRREPVARSAEVYIEDSGLAAVLPLALSPARAARLNEPELAAALERGLTSIREGRVSFRDPAMRERLLAAHARAA
jgi:phosphoserine phosphatase